MNVRDHHSTTDPKCPSPADLARVREVQRLAYRCAEEVAAGLEPGVTERETCDRMRHWLERNGVDDWFHVPFAWFGDRAAFDGFRSPLQFLPTNRELTPGMGFILDCAPSVRGATADIGYTGSLGANPVLDRLRADLIEHRELIVDLVRERMPFDEIYRRVDGLASRQGLENRHQAYPYRVLAHRVEVLPPGRPRGRIAGFGTRHLHSLTSSRRAERRQGWSPLWSDHERSAHAPVPGLWAVEPHLAFRGVGAKFEELLVVTDTDAHWLDDDLPHLRPSRVPQSQDRVAPTSAATHGSAGAAVPVAAPAVTVESAT